VRWPPPPLAWTRAVAHAAAPAPPAAAAALAPPAAAAPPLRAWDLWVDDDDDDGARATTAYAAAPAACDDVYGRDGSGFSPDDEPCAEAYGDDHATATAAPPPLLTLASLAPLCLRRRDVAALAAAPARVLAPHGGLGALLCGAHVRIRVAASDAESQADGGASGAAFSYRLMPVRGCFTGDGGALVLQLRTHGGGSEKALKDLSDGAPAHEAEAAALVAAAAAAGGSRHGAEATRRRMRAKAAALEAALEAARAAGGPRPGRRACGVGTRRL
jgi:hypothetical protein